MKQKGSIWGWGGRNPLLFFWWIVYKRLKSVTQTSLVLVKSGKRSPFSMGRSPFLFQGIPTPFFRIFLLFIKGPEICGCPQHPSAGAAHTPPLGRRVEWGASCDMAVSPGLGHSPPLA